MEILKIADLVVNIVLIVVSIALIIVVMLQKSKSAGLGAAFGGESPSLSPKAKTASREVILQKITVWLSVAVGVLALGLVVISNFIK